MTLAVSATEAIILGLALLAAALVAAARTPRWLLPVHLLAAAALGALLTQPQRANPAGDTAVVVTPGHGGPVPPGAIRLDDLSPGKLADLSPRRLRVLGHGLPLPQWRAVAAVLAPTPPALPPGLLDVAWPRHAELGEAVQVQGRVQGLAAARITLTGPGDLLLDEAPVSEDDRFTVQTLPPDAGPATLYLNVLDAAGRVLRSEPVPVWVKAPAGPRVLLQLAGPSFESRALFRWLARSTAGVRLVAPVGRQAVREAVAGLDPPAADAWLASPAELDLLAVDVGWLRQLGAPRSNLLRDAVRAGLGLVVLPSGWESGRSEGWALPEWLGAFDTAAHDLAAGEDIPIADGMTVTALATRGSLEALATSPEGRPLALRQRLGTGNVALVLLTESASLNTRGAAGTYADLWQRVVNPVLRKTPAPASLSLPLPVLYPGEPVQRCTGLSCRTRWPARSGWHDLEGVWHYVFEPGQWETWRAAAVQEQTAVAAGLRSQAGRAAPVPMLWPSPALLWLVFVACAATLWAVQKFAPGAAGHDRPGAADPG